MEMFTNLTQAKRTYTRHKNILLQNQALLNTLANRTDLTITDLTTLTPTYDFYSEELDKLREARLYIEQNIDDDAQLTQILTDSDETHITEMQLVLLKISLLIHQLQPPIIQPTLSSASSSSEVISTNTRQVSGIKLPQIRLARFAGDYSEFNKILVKFSCASTLSDTFIQIWEIPILTRPAR
uniref:Uncharacterized protein n=1 Tax=Cacopsylla melanoneura TaxID=428564 RepID=A0A8D8W7D8_9HEMI